MSKNSRKETLLAQYRECFNDKRAQIAMIWQIPSLIMLTLFALAGLTLTSVYKKKYQNK